MADTDHGKLGFWESPAARVTVGVLVGAIVTAVLWDRNGMLSLLGGWTALTLTFSVWTWIVLWRFDSGKTKDHAERESPWHWAVVSLVLGGALVSLSGVWVLLNKAHDDGGRWLAVGSIVLSWFTIHTLYALIYAKHYFNPARGGGIDFNDPHNNDQPSYTDFFYVAFAVGMSFAISDTNLTSTCMRKTALVHGLLSFVFGTTIVASVVNVISSG
ncbi:putative membrane protein [Mycolicibacterium sp. BK556]|uniref:DUF1345 domain-containing protein n=1 Tax=unclassified Mycolicibacterium TaxID=2636767 RepID=UPI001617F623|nr:MULTISPECIES: DUF1345 domain-containing protein [unclassified Mycolicibacterium]MBB3603080.1 putative membrane protein [Mycolicibacterium sp. BK556]MBB3633275.1 putative membrane protein [Mycolicibacterium sp. BK607]